jgi:hypothetical protein
MIWETAWMKFMLINLNAPDLGEKTPQTLNALPQIRYNNESGQNNKGFMDEIHVHEFECSGSGRKNPANPKCLAPNT